MAVISSISAAVAPRAARAAATPSSAPRASRTNSASSSEKERTRAPRLASISTSPSWARRTSTARSVVRLTPSRSATSTSTSRSRGAYTPCSISARSRAWAASKRETGAVGASAISGESRTSARTGSGGRGPCPQDLGWVVAHHGAHLALGEGVVEQLAHERTQALVGVGRGGLAEIGGQDGARRADFADIGVDLLPGDLARVRGGEAAFEEHAQARQVLLLGNAEQRRRELGVGDDDAFHPNFLRGFDHRQDLRGANVAGGEN